MNLDDRITFKEDGTMVIDLKPDNCPCWVCQEIDKQRIERNKDEHN